MEDYHDLNEQIDELIDKRHLNIFIRRPREPLPPAFGLGGEEDRCHRWGDLSREGIGPSVA